MAICCSHIILTTADTMFTAIHPSFLGWCITLCHQYRTRQSVFVVDTTTQVRARAGERLGGPIGLVCVPGRCGLLSAAPHDALCAGMAALPSMRQGGAADTNNRLRHCFTSVIKPLLTLVCKAARADSRHKAQTCLHACCSHRVLP